MSSSLSLPNPVSVAIVPKWSVALGSRLRGLALAREKGWLLCWDENHWLCLLNSNGDRQGQVRAPDAMTGACTADDGTAHVAVGRQGEVWWLAPDLSLRWERSLGHRALTVAVDPFGQYTAVADSRGSLHVLDRKGNPLLQAQTPRPLRHLAFVPGAPFLLGSADFGFVGCFDWQGRCVWREALVTHVGSLAVSGNGEVIVLTCYSEGLQRYTLGGKNLGRLSLSEPARLAAVSIDGRQLLVAGLSTRLLLARGERAECTCDLESSPVAIALSALGSEAVAALPNGTITGLELATRKPS